jgi:long-chain fatty acid transport protein
MRRYLIGLTLMIFVLPGIAFSGGYEFGGLGAKAVSMGGAFIGLADDWTSIYWNPAGLTQLKGKGAGVSLEYSILVGKDKSSVANDDDFGTFFARAYGPNSLFSGYPGEPTRFTKEKIETDALLPSFGYYQKFEGFTVGGGIYIPNGNAIDWDDRMKDTSTGADIKASYHSLLFISVGNISLAKEIIDDLSIGTGLNLIYGRSEIKAEKTYRSSAMPNLNYDFTNKMDGDGIGLEGIVGFLFKASDKISIGGVARSGSLLELKGKGEGKLHGVSLPETLTGSEKSDYTQRFSYPATCGLGVAYRLTPRMTITCDWIRTYWSSMEEDIDFDLDTGGPGSPTTKFTQDRDRSLNWNNTDRLRIGLEYRPNETWSLRAGFFSDPSPVPAEEVDITRLIDTDAKFITLGAGYKKGEWLVDFCYVHSSGKETLNGVEYKEDGDSFMTTGLYRF